MVPSFSSTVAVGKKNISVPIFVGSAPSRRQNAEVSVSYESITTIHFKRSMAARASSLLSPDAAGFMPMTKYPSTRPSFIAICVGNAE